MCRPGKQTQRSFVTGLGIAPRALRVSTLVSTRSRPFCKQDEGPASSISPFDNRLHGNACVALRVSTWSNLIRHITPNCEGLVHCWFFMLSCLLRTLLLCS